MLPSSIPPQHGGVYTQYPRTASSTSSNAKASVAAGGSVGLDSTVGSDTSLASNAAPQSKAGKQTSTKAHVPAGLKSGRNSKKKGSDGVKQNDMEANVEDSKRSDDASCERSQSFQRCESR